ncbi:trypsin-like serine protease [Bradyrhizobium sp. LTSP885]|uniref:trypsin-like serine peptidase n=1 Tax=Bradyrhizobium sp. LTSP885 TaxID=1619232 RepID=UPI00069CB95A|nr:trypsin-like serine protease [Bradyrhizobium sp. LTSP885]
MNKALQWSSASAEQASENSPAFEVLETASSAGSDPADPVQTDADLLVFGKREKPIKPKGVRVGFETIIGEDDRVKITETKARPWRMIAGLKLISRAPLTSTFIGTGWFIGPRTLLTAGHCVHSSSDFNGWIGSIEVSPGRNGGTFPYSTVTATKFFALQQWITSADPDYDIGCIQISKPLGDTVGYFKIASLSDADLQNALVNISGYPADLDNGRSQYFHANRVLRSSARRIYYDVDTYGGQSGSPVWVQDSATAEPQAVAVHAYGTGGTAPSLGITANSGPRLSAEIVATVREWLAAASA